MIIEQVELRNFRSHRDSIINFLPGVNVILGKNGSGKSSIVEAIGWVFSGDSDWQKDELLKRGENSGAVKVTFTSDDGIKYCIYRDLKKQKYELTRVNDGLRIASGTKDVVAKCGEMLGILQNQSILYKNVVCAYQNKFISLFNKASDNTEMIESIINSKIYNSIAENITNNIKKKYIFEKSNLENKVAELNSIINSYGNLDTDIQNRSKELDKVIDSINKIEIEKREISTKKEEFRILRLAIEALEKQVSVNQENCKSIVQDILHLQNRLDNSKNAKSLLSENEDDYNRYNILKKDIELLENKVKTLDLIAQKQRQCKESINGLHTKFALLEAECNTLKNNIVTDTADQKAKVIELESIQYQIRQSEIEFASCNEKYNKINDFYTKFKEISGNITENERHQKNLATSIVQDFIFPDTLEGVLDNLYNTLKITEDSRSKRDALNNKIAILKEKISENQKAQSELSTGKCPILNEECKNVRQGGNSSYFEKREIELNNEINTLKNIVDSEYNTIDFLFKECRNSITENELLKRQSEKNIHDNQLIEFQVKSIDKDLEILYLRRIMLLRDNNIDIGISDDQIIADTNNKLQDRKEEIVRLKNNEEHYSIKEKELQNILDILSKRLKNNVDRIDENEKLGNYYFNQIHDLNKDLEQYSVELTDYNTLKNKLDSDKALLKSLELSHRLYVENLQSANQIDEIQKQILDKQRFQNNSNSELDSLEIELKKQNEKYNTINIKELDERLKSFQNQIAEYEKNKQEYLEELAVSKQKLKQRESEQNLLSNKEKELAKLRKKVDLTDKYIKYLKYLNVNISKLKLKSIEDEATNNYRKIATSEERIRWNVVTTGKSSNYELILEKPGITEKPRSFGMLSGGEQVSVALSLRAALLSQFTDAKFTILDEPTINLDDERKEALAEALPVMLKNVKQAIIITHDDFGVIADNYIELSEMY